MAQKRSSIDDAVTYNDPGHKSSMSNYQTTVPQKHDHNSLLNSPSRQYNMAEQTLTLPIKRRNLPIEPKKKVFNEWGAVMRHQDELEEKVRLNELELQKNLQKAFKNNLDQQRFKRQQEVQMNKDRDRSEDRDVMIIQAQQDKQRDEQENKKRSEIRDNVRQKAKESIDEKERLRFTNKQKEEEYR